MQKSNRERILIIADVLGELCDKVVFVGGSVPQFYSDDPAVPEHRSTDDVDCIVDLSSYASYSLFCEGELAERKIHHDVRPGAPMCRFICEDKDDVIDIMPIEDSGIGDSNRWYSPGFAVRKAYELSSGRIIYLMPVLYYIASKLEALRSRGGDDYRGAKDFDDVVYVLNSCSDVLVSCKQCDDKELLNYLSDEFSLLLRRKNIDEEIACALYPEDDEDRVELVKEMMTFMSGCHQ